MFTKSRCLHRRPTRGICFLQKGVFSEPGADDVIVLAGPRQVVGGPLNALVQRALGRPQLRGVVPS